MGRLIQFIVSGLMWWLCYILVGFTAGTHPNLRGIPQRHNISYAEFRDEFGEPGVPVVISGAVSHWPAAQWTLELSRIRQRCGSEPVARECNGGTNAIKFYNASLVGDQWGALQYANLTEDRSISSLDDLLDRQLQKAGRRLYLHDQSIDILCPSLLDDVRAPRYFPHDYLMQVASPHRMAHNCASEHGGPGHPSIFLGPGGTQSGLHADAAASRFWMAVFQGTKWFRLVNQSYAEEHMYPTTTTTTENLKLNQKLPEGQYHAHFEVDTFDPDFERHPKFKEAQIWEANVTAGDLIFIPEKWLHQVRNMDYTIAMSYNFVDEHNFEQHMQWRKSNPGTRAHPSRIAANQVCGPVAFDKSSLLSTAATGTTYKRTCCEVHPFAARSYFPVNYTSHPNRADEPWSTFFRR
jgi:hypothetical protein